jgi:nitroreductase
MVSERQANATVLEPYRQMMIGGVVKGMTPAGQREWAARQCYIALGQFMTSAAVLGVDTCAIEGLDAAQYDEILGLAGTGYQTVVACVAGYRSSQDKYASMKKIRYPAARVIAKV